MRIRLYLAHYLTNYVVAKLPSYTIRHFWYRRVLGLKVGAGSALLMGLYLYIPGRPHPGRRGISIGEHTVINRQCCLDGRGGLSIGSNVSLSPGVWLLTDQHDIDDPEFREQLAPITIGDYAFLGARALVLPGVTIGDGAVVAAGAVVTKDVPPHTVVAGVPARPVGVRRGDLRYQMHHYKHLFE